jgi:transcriptional regulator with XRE-family HTH domain
VSASCDVFDPPGGMHNERLRVLLLERGLKPEDLAAEIGVDPKTVERWITKSRVPYRKHRYATAAFLGVDEAEIWPDALTSAQVAAASENEVAAFYPHRWAVPREAWQRLFEKAQREIGVLVYSGMFLAEDRGALRTLGRKATAGVQVRILMGDPGSELVAQRGADEGIGEGMAARIRNSLVLLGPLRSQDGVEMRLHRTVLYNSMYLADDQALVNCHVYGAPASEAPVMHLRKVPGGDMLATYQESFEKVWEGAAPVE